MENALVWMFLGTWTLVAVAASIGWAALAVRGSRGVTGAHE